MLKLCTKEAGEVREEGTETILMQYNTTNGFILTMGLFSQTEVELSRFAQNSKFHLFF